MEGLPMVKIFKKLLVGIALIALLGAALGLIIRNRLAATKPTETASTTTDDNAEEGSLEPAEGTSPEAPKTNLPKSSLVGRWSSQTDVQGASASPAKSATSSNASSTTDSISKSPTKSSARASNWPSATAGSKETTPLETNPKKQPATADLASPPTADAQPASPRSGSRWNEETNSDDPATNANLTGANRPTTNDNDSPSAASTLKSNQPASAGPGASAANSQNVENSPSTTITSTANNGPATEGPSTAGPAKENAFRESTSGAGGTWHAKTSDLATNLLNSKNTNNGPAKSGGNETGGNAWSGVSSVDEKLDKLAANANSRWNHTADDLGNAGRNFASRTRENAASAAENNLDRVRGNLKSDRALGDLKKWADKTTDQAETDDWPTAGATAERDDYNGKLPNRSTSLASNTGSYDVKLDDSYWTIAKSHYGAGAYFEALYEHNRTRLNDPDHLEVGDVLLTPSVEELQKMFPDLVPRVRLPGERIAPERFAAAPRSGGVGSRPQVELDSAPGSLRSRPNLASSAPNNSARTPGDLLSSFPPSETARSIQGGRGVQGGRSVQGGTYTAQRGDTLFKIARDQLGNASRWVDLYELNRDVLGEDLAVQPGLELSMPKAER